MTSSRSLIEPLEARIAPATIFLTNSNKQLISVDSAAPGTILSTTAITGLGETERIEGIDFRPASGELYLLGITDTAGADEARLYILNPASGVATPFRATPFGTNLIDAARYGFDIDPATDRARVVNNADQNYNAAASSGQNSFQAAILADPGFAEAIYGAAYDRSFDGTPTTTLYGLEFGADRLVTIGPPTTGRFAADGGTVTRVGPLGVVVSSENAGFDIDGVTGISYAALSVNGGANSSKLYTINLVTGAATLLGPIGPAAFTITGLAVAPPQATFVNDKTATYTDEDGDLVTVKITKGSLTAQDLQFALKEGGGLQLRKLDLSGALEGMPQLFAKTNVSISAKPQDGRGNGFADVGRIFAPAVDLGAILVDGDLSRLDCGDANTAKTSPGLVSLTVQSMGLRGDATNDTGFAIARINGPVGKLIVKTDMAAGFSVLGGLGTPQNGTLGSAFIGGDMVNVGSSSGSAIRAEGSIGKVTIIGSMRGETGSGSDVLITAGGDIRALAVTGSVIGGNDITGYVSAKGKIGTVTIGGDLRGGTGNESGFIEGKLGIKSVTVRGSIVGGGGANSGYLTAGTDLGTVKVGGDIKGGTAEAAGGIHADGNIGTVTVGRSLLGGTALSAGAITAFKLDGLSTIASVKIGGNVEGGSGESSGQIYAKTFLAQVTIAGFLKGGSATESGSVAVFSNTPDAKGIGRVTVGMDIEGGSATASGSIFTGFGDIGSVSVTGSVIGGSTVTTGIFSARRLGPVTIGADLRASSAFNAPAVAIVADGEINPPTVKAALAIASLTVRGDVVKAQVLGGYDNVTRTVNNADAQIGNVTVGGNWIASSIAAGVVAGNGIFGDADDTAFPDPTPADNLPSRIAAIVIKGYAMGTIGAVAGPNPGSGSTTDGYGFVAQQIGSLKIGKSTVPFTAGASNDLLLRLLGPTRDLQVREV